MVHNINHSEHGPHSEDSPRAFELTFWCFGRQPLLNNERWNRVLAESIDRAFEHHAFSLAAFTFMPECVQLVVVQQGPTANVPRLLYTMKRTFAQWVKHELSETDPALQKRLTVRDGPGLYIFRFWEPGPGRVRDLSSPSAFAGAIETIHAGPVRNGLCETPDKWKWSSWRQYDIPAQPLDSDLPKIQVSIPNLMPTSTHD